MRPRLFPSRFNLLLDEAERGALQDLFELHPNLVDESELLHEALRAGIKQLNEADSAQLKEPERPPNRTEVQARKRALADDDRLVMDFPSHIELDLTEEQQEGMQYLADHLPHRSDEKLLGTILERGIDLARQELAKPFKPTFAPAVRPRGIERRDHVENYIGVPLEERLRMKLEDFLLSHEDALPDEKAYAMLLDLGLDAADQPIDKVIATAKRAARSRRTVRRAGRPLVRR